MSLNSKGYSLLEVLVSLSILLWLSSLLVPSYAELKARRSVSLKVWEIKRSMEYARNLAITHNRTMLLCAATETYQCVQRSGSRLVVFEDQNEDYQWSADEPLYRDIDTGDALIELSASSHAYVKFLSSGRIGRLGNFQICTPSAGDFGRQVIFFRSGRIRLSKDSNQDGYDEKDGSPIRCAILVKLG